MRALDKRIAALESTRSIDDLTHLTDEELRQRMHDVSEKLAAAGWEKAGEFGAAIERGDLRAIDRLIEELKCEISDAE